jgi:hypothetical protein
VWGGFGRCDGRGGRVRAHFHHFDVGDGDRAIVTITVTVAVAVVITIAIVITIANSDSDCLCISDIVATTAVDHVFRWCGQLVGPLITRLQHLLDRPLSSLRNSPHCCVHFLPRALAEGRGPRCLPWTRSVILRGTG